MSVLHELAPAAIEVAINLLAAGTLLSLIVAAAFAIARHSAPRVRYAVAVLAFFAAAILPFATMLRTSRPLDTTVSVVTAVSPTQEVPQETVRRIASWSNTSSSAFILTAIWATVALLLLGRELAGHLLLYFRRRTWDLAPWELERALDWPGERMLFVSDSDGPSTAGLFAPAVVLPSAWLASLEPDVARRVARHELAHVRWRDPLVHALVRLVRAALWISAPLWYLERVIRTEREVAADAFAVHADTGDDRGAIALAYATSFVAAAQRRSRRHRAAAALDHGLGLEERMQRLLAVAAPGAFRTVAAALVLVCGGAMLFALPLPSFHRAPALHAVPFDATPRYRESALALNAILAGTRYHDHEATPAVHQLLVRIRSTSIAPLADALSAPDRRTRESAAWIAGELRDPRLVPSLLATLADADPHVRQTVIWALGTIRDRRATLPLIALLADPSYDVQLRAAWALGAIGDARARLPLAALYHSTWNDAIHSEAKLAVRRTGGYVK